jgi:murein DD-endopeptidase MepM/ murein hydrolase activator NlpD
MNRRLIGIFSIIILLLPLTSFALTQDEVQKQIEDRNARLNQLNQELQSTQTNLKQVQTQKQSLEKQVKTLDTTIKQLDINIEQDDLTKQKLGLEIESLRGEIDKINDAIASRKVTVGELFRQLQKMDDANVFVTLLSNGKLTDLVTDAQNIESLRLRIALDVSELNHLSDDYYGKVTDMSQKQKDLDVHQVNLANRKAIVADQKQTKNAILAETKNQESVYQEKLTELQKQQDALEDEVDALEKQLGQNFNSNVLPAKGTKYFSWPLADVRITQHFGVKSKLYRGKPHNGLDLAASVGTPVLAAADGTVIGVDDNDISRTRKYQYGKYVMIRHANGFATLYGHLSRQVVSVGMTVKRGDIIGYSGSTGYATGPHLHFGLYWASTVEFKSIPPAQGLVPVGVILNPEDYL